MKRDYKCFSGNPAVEAKLPQRQLLERLSASFGFAAKQDVQGRKRFMSANEANFQSSPVDYHEKRSWHLSENRQGLFLKHL